MANEDGYTSIGFPAIGTGDLEYPVDVVAKYMYDTVNTFATNFPNCIMSVNLVLHNEEAFKIYRNEHMKRLLTAELISLEKNIEKAKLEQKSDDKRSWPLKFTIYGLSLQDIDNAKKGLGRVIEGQYKIEEHHDRLLSVTADEERPSNVQPTPIITQHCQTPSNVLHIHTWIQHCQRTQQQPSYAYANTTIPEIQHRPNYSCTSTIMPEIQQRPDYQQYPNNSSVSNWLPRQQYGRPTATAHHNY
ncbi:Hypothetical predicted protein [Mytilus galloprovincialis]|uniref:Macro domain-containing protein n=1 Tax=Mytilus galloprovincialis TaxID=29158 RepID=A0A8B6D9P7_MYTGA|nr:Hypothetical predicted protein [Mytilus galloprovincialis]